MDNPRLLDLNNNFKALSVLGRGAKGVVFLIHTPTSPLLALKAISTPEKPRRIWCERDILLSLNHPLLPSLHGILETDRIVAFAIDHCPGGDLNALRRRQTEQMFADDVIRFYAAELVLALDHLHQQNIMYRDLKPDNVLIQSNGHIMLVDFDLSSNLPSQPLLPEHLKSKPAQPTPSPPPPPPRKSWILHCFSHDSGVSPEDSPESGDPPPAPANRSNSFVGTEEYVAPEMIRGDGHDFSVDWWGLGVVLYEMLYGRTPFRGQNRKETFYRVLAMEPDLSGERTPLRDLIGRLLEKDQTKRISVQEIKRHEFFRGVDWESILEVRRPPFIPMDVEDLGEGEAIDVEKFVEDTFRNPRQEEAKTGDFSAF